MDPSDAIVNAIMSEGPGVFASSVNVVNENKKTEREMGKFKRDSEYLYEKQMEFMPAMETAFEIINTDVGQSSNKGEDIEYFLLNSVRFKL